MAGVARSARESLAGRDRRFLEEALDLGRRGWGSVHPNPLVGCVLAHGDRVVGRGWHAQFGGPHAEAVALAEAGEAARGATAYVSLEPCRHEGKTPPCADALVSAGVTRVVYGLDDPGELSGGGAAALRAAGVDVVGPVWGAEVAHRENGPFFHLARHDTPWVALKLAMSLDGMIARRPGERTLVTGPEAAREVHRLRSGHDAILVGSGTAVVDDPRLTVRHGGARRQPTRVVLDSRARLDPGARVFEGVEEAPVLVFVGPDARGDAVRRLRDAGARVLDAAPDADGLDLGDVLRRCRAEGLGAILCEGGGRVAASLVRGGWLGRMYLFVSPIVFGGGAVPAFPGLEDAGAWRAWSVSATPGVFGRDGLLVVDRPPAGETAGAVEGDA